ncbi:MAG: cytochrome P450 [Gammaproteobacteria bacterium]|jgi:cytochrome P450|nr:cytochrome P450 [Gammaproteobacteria bacterium]MBT5725501.1 cytochrome P450 [Gammaproteobacteria bacterium]MBT6583995.1 cytochrome P450 [Gammaproteobacteria bacterium]MBT6892568.1 cytochrome P450 [Gammaproteobacteria bacterium]
MSASIQLAGNAALSDVNPADPKLFSQEKILPYFKQMRAEKPVHYCKESAYGPFWSVTRYEDIMAVDKNHQQFSSDAHYGGIMIDDDIVGDVNGDFFVQSFITMDQPEHGPQRKAVSKIVAPTSLQKFESIIRGRTQTLLDSLPVGEEFDWVDTVSIELTTMMLATLLDFPFEDRRKLTRWSDVTVAEGDSPVVGSQEQRIAELIECLEYFKKLKAERRDGPANLDLVTMLAQDAATANQPDAQFLGNLLLLIVGGNDTTRNTMSGSINALHQYPEQMDLLRAKPELIDNMVSEVVRWQTPLSHMRRTVIEDTVIGSQPVKKGDKVVMWYYSGNRDEAKFENADAFDITRANARNSVSFGFGVHRCLGMRLAELQMRILWQEILSRWQRIEIVGDVERVESNFVNGYSKMPVRIIK